MAEVILGFSFGCAVGALAVAYYLSRHINASTDRVLNRPIPPYKSQSKPRVIKRTEAQEAEIEEKRLAQKGWDATSET
jgi:hypothetical protein